MRYHLMFPARATVRRGAVAAALTVALGAVLPAQLHASPAAGRAAAAGGSAALLAGVTPGCPDPADPSSGPCTVLMPTGAGRRTGVQAAGALPPGYSPAQLQAAYGMQSVTAGMRQTVAVVTPFDDPNAESDLAVYRAQFSLPPCTSTDGCFSKIGELGAGSPLPPANNSWAAGTSTQLDVISAICPNCHLLLVEATTAGIADIGTGVNTAVSLGAKVITTSEAQPEAVADTSSDSAYFNHPGVAITAPSYNDGYGVIAYPAASPDVTAVGGTTLTQATGTVRGWTETTWANTSSGCSSYEPKPAWQTDTGCTTRTLNDVSADADPNTGVAVYDTYEVTTTGWQAGNGAGGTSVAAAIVAGVYALGGTPAAGTYPAAYPYQHPGGSYTTPGGAYPYADGLNDIADGSSNGTCTPAYLCTSGPGYDAPTGVGTPSFTTTFAAGGSLNGYVYSGVPGECLAESGAPANGNKIVIWACQATSYQYWTAGSDGTVRVFGKCLDVAGAHTANNSLIDLYTCVSGAANQQWQVQSDGELVNPVSGRCLDDPNLSTINNTQLDIYDCVPGAVNEHWAQPYPVPSAGAITSQAAPGKCVDDSGGGTADGNKIDIYDCNGGSAQSWTVEADGTVRVFFKCMATASDGTTNGTKVELYTCTGDSNQQWIARADGSLLNRRSGTCLDDPGGFITNGTALDISTCNQAAYQSWNLPH
jgi:Ricin-type beta-trefoil lectin domain